MSDTTNNLELVTCAGNEVCSKKYQLQVIELENSAQINLLLVERFVANFINKMTESHIKEQLSNNFLRILAANGGYMIDKPELDYGVDFTVSRVFAHSYNGTTRYLKDNKYIDIQLKATTESGVTIDPLTSNIKFTLEAKTYNDLITRRNTANLTPLVLILFVMPSDRSAWVDINDNEILLRKCAYWFMPSVGTPLTPNQASITIEIPAGNKLTLDCFLTFYNTFYI